MEIWSFKSIAFPFPGPKENSQHNSEGKQYAQKLSKNFILAKDAVRISRNHMKSNVCSRGKMRGVSALC